MVSRLLGLVVMITAMEIELQLVFRLVDSNLQIAVAGGPGHATQGPYYI